MSNDGIYVESVSNSGELDNRLANLDDSMRRALIIVGKRIVFRIIALQEQERPHTIATGQTLRSHSVSQVYSGTDGTGKFVAVKVGPRTGYAYWGIEAGRSAGTPPPLRRIVQWVREKPGGSGLSERDLYAVAKKVQQTIAQTGTPAYFILSKAADIEIPGFVVTLRTTAAQALNGK